MLFGSVGYGNLVVDMLSLIGDRIAHPLTNSSLKHNLGV